ncbi:alpha/beta-hydrolase [Xylariaceae sp. FL0662B]|nr:alpha/beta-hydrolase [Xylariaceae sp. FL0662B]
MLPLAPLSGLLGGGGSPGLCAPTVSRAALLCVSVGLILAPLIKSRSGRGQQRKLFTPSPLAAAQTEKNLPYPPDALPGARDVATPYGSIRVYEWGPEDGDRVLLVHGISTPAVALGDLAHELVGRGCRVMLFDLFGRGYSDAPRAPLPYDTRLYTTQILLVLASSARPWTEFHLAGYSLGGGLCVAFARYFPHLVRSLTLIASGGLIRPHHVGWRSRALYGSGLLPEVLVRYLVRRRIRPGAELPPPPPRMGSAYAGAVAAAESSRLVDRDASGGASFDGAAISRRHPGVSVSSVVRWQVDRHEGFVAAFISTIRHAPIYAPQADWEALAAILRARRAGAEAKEPGLRGGRVLMVLGEHDPVIVKDETVHDSLRVFGRDGVEFAVLPGGHELPITRSAEVADAMEKFWRGGGELRG